MNDSKPIQISSGWSQVGNLGGPDWDTARDFARQALIFHDREVGLQAEIWKLKQEVTDLELELENQKNSFETSMSWRVGRTVLWPVRALKQLPKRRFTSSDKGNR